MYANWEMFNCFAHAQSYVITHWGAASLSVYLLSSYTDQRETSLLSTQL